MFILQYHGEDFMIKTEIFKKFQPSLWVRRENVIAPYAYGLEWDFAKCGSKYKRTPRLQQKGKKQGQGKILLPQTEGHKINLWLSTAILRWLLWSTGHRLSINEAVPHHQPSLWTRLLCQPTKNISAKVFSFVNVTSKKQSVCII